MKKKYLALDLGNDARLLDHLAPLCDLFSMPLLVCEEKKLELLKKYYPQVEAMFLMPHEIDYERLALEYDVFFQSIFLQDRVLEYFGALHGKKNRFVYCPHGNSDKGYIKPLLSQIVFQDIVLYYGEQMKQRLVHQKLWDKISCKMRIGNYRYRFYQEHKAFYDELVQKEIFSHLDPSKKTVFYAPTWEDGENTSSFFRLGKKIADDFSSEVNLIIKPHPLLEELDVGRYFQTLGYFQEKKGVVILEDYPLIYPLLSKVDYYLGDFSSIGYDFLAFQKPMFFFVADLLSQTQGVPSSCLSCGIQVDEEKNLFSFIEENHSHAEKLACEQKLKYENAFGKMLFPYQAKDAFSCLIGS